MKIFNLKNGWPVLGAILLITASLSVLAQEDGKSVENSASAAPIFFFSPSSVPGQIADDKNVDETFLDSTLPESFTEWKQGLQEQNGFSFTLDYSAAVVKASNTINDDDTFSGGVIRLYGQWDLIGRESGNTGSLIFKVENRHGYTDPSANGAKDEIGYVGLMYPTFSDIGLRYTNLYWKQNLNHGNTEIIAGFLDATDWVDVYALASPWSGFSNFAFATGSATIALPDDAALGAYFNAMLTDRLYLITGFTDSNADSTDPLEGFDTIGDGEFIKTIELGLVSSKERFYLDNTHITFWHADEREEAGVNEGHGVSFSYSHSYNEKWMPFLRAGYAEDGGTLLQKSVSTGFGYHWGANNSLLGLGLNWGEPNEDTFGASLRDQTSIELFTRLEITKYFQLSPAIEYLHNPALNTDADHSWVLGLRGRIYL